MNGTVLTKSNYGVQGQFSVNGQRDNANYFMIDGVSANVGIGGGASLVQTAGGAVPAFTALGGTNNLVSVDALQEFRIQTSTYAPEFGRMPGGQVSIITRSGTNQFHATLFNYFRNDVLDANDWFANNLGLRKPPLRQNDFGGVVGGPILRNRTFVFFSYEGLRLRLPQVAIWEVPSRETRRAASPAVQPLLNAFPLPNGADLGSGFAEFDASYANPSNLDAVSIRGDHAVSSRLTFFGRYNYAPSDSVVRNLSSLSGSSLKTETLTLGSTQAVTAGISNELRANYSRTKAAGFFSLDQFGGAVVPADSALFPPFATHNDALANFGVASSGLFWGKNADNTQRQINLVDGVSIVTGNHQLKLGVDYRRLSPISDRSHYSLLVGFDDAGAAIAGNASFVSVAGGQRSLGMNPIDAGRIQACQQDHGRQKQFSFHISSPWFP